MQAVDVSALVLVYSYRRPKIRQMTTHQDDYGYPSRLASFGSGVEAP